MKTSHFLAFLGGVVAGGITALLLAPKSGKETREDIREFIEDGYDRAKDYIGKEGRKVKRAINHSIDKLHAEEIRMKAAAMQDED